MPCPLELGVFSICETMSLGMIAPVAGDYAFQIFMNGSHYQYQTTLILNEEFTLPPFLLNPNSTILLKIINPDGSIYQGLLPDFTPLPENEFIIKTVINRVIPLIDPQILP